MISIRPSDPLRSEHRELLPRIERLREVADHVGSAPIGALRAELDELHGFLTRSLTPHALAEDEILYPAVARLLGSPRATATMRRDHEEIGRLIADLGATRRELVDVDLSWQQARELRRILYGLYTLVRTHFAKEEEIYLPLLDERLTVAEGTALFAAMHAAAFRIATTT